MRVYSLLFAALTLGATLSAQAPAKGAALPRTPWGHPDLQGTYSNDDETGTPMERLTRSSLQIEVLQFAHCFRADRCGWKSDVEN